MLDVTNAKIEALALHRIGNLSRSEDSIYANKLLDLDKNLKTVLLKYFLKPFISNDEYYTFTHHEDLDFNEVNSYCENIINDKSIFVEQSLKIAQHLYSVTNHPNILSGELSICRISGIYLDKKEVGSIGIFKSEIKDYFIKYQETTGRNLTMILEEGSNINQLDKGALILNTDGKKVLITDKRKSDTQYWLKDFLGLVPMLDDQYKTAELLKSCLNFSHNVLSRNSEKQNVIKFKQKVFNYFNANKEFIADDLFDFVGLESDKKKIFKAYVAENIGAVGFSIQDTFLVNNEKVTKIRKKNKNIIKLDENFEIKVKDSEREALKNIEKGFDEDRNMHFYKVYFNEEL